MLKKATLIPDTICGAEIFVNVNIELDYWTGWWCGFVDDHRWL